MNGDYGKRFDKFLIKLTKEKRWYLMQNNVQTSKECSDAEEIALFS